MIHLQYIGKVEGIGHLCDDNGVALDARMWNVFAPGHEYHRSTRMMDGLIELGIIPERKVA